MRDIHHDENYNYKCEIEHIERVKPYGPHLDHLVVDLLLTKILLSPWEKKISQRNVQFIFIKLVSHDELTMHTY
jgi:hypothetical protein